MLGELTAKERKIRIDGKSYPVTANFLRGEQILALARYEWQRYDLQIKFFSLGDRKLVPHDELVNLSDPNIQRFEVIPKEAQQGGK